VINTQTIFPHKSITSLLEDIQIHPDFDVRTSSERKILDLLKPSVNSPIFQTKKSNDVETISKDTYIHKCKEHNEEDLLFICEICDKKCVCIECISNGLHRNHDI